MSIRLQFSSASFQRRLGQIIAQSENPVEILMASGREVANQLKSHFRDRDQQAANKLSERRSHFWLQVAQSVSNPEQTGYNAVSVTVSDPRFAQKVFGGPIIAQKAGALTIPVEERAYDRTAATFEVETGLKLFLVKTGGGDKNNFENAVLAVKEDPKDKWFTVEYILTKSVTQSADANALPEKTALESAILVRAQRTLDNQLESENPTPEP